MVSWLVDGVAGSALGVTHCCNEKTFNINNYLKSYNNELTKKTQNFKTKWIIVTHLSLMMIGFSLLQSNKRQDSLNMQLTYLCPRQISKS